MKRILRAGLGISALLTAAPLRTAYAADLTPVLPPAPAWSWTGFYLGGSIGAGFGDKWWTAENAFESAAAVVAGVPGQNVGTASMDGFLAAFQAGYNWQNGQWVFGVETAWTWTDMRGSFPYQSSEGVLALTIGGFENGSSKLDWIGTVVGRVGVTIDRAWVYAGGGGAWTEEKDSVLLNTGAIPETTEWHGSNTKFGWTLLTGVEYAIDPHWSARVQYNYYDFGSNNVTLTTTGGGVIGTAAPTLSTSTELHISTVTAGVNYRF